MFTGFRFSTSAQKLLDWLKRAQKGLPAKAEKQTNVVRDVDVTRLTRRLILNPEKQVSPIYTRNPLQIFSIIKPRFPLTRWYTTSNVLHSPATPCSFWRAINHVNIDKQNNNNNLHVIYVYLSPVHLDGILSLAWDEKGKKEMLYWLSINFILLEHFKTWHVFGNRLFFIISGVCELTSKR